MENPGASDIVLSFMEPLSADWKGDEDVCAYTITCGPYAPIHGFRNTDWKCVLATRAVAEVAGVWFMGYSPPERPDSVF